MAASVSVQPELDLMVSKKELTLLRYHFPPRQCQQIHLQRTSLPSFMLHNYYLCTHESAARLSCELVSSVSLQ